MPAMKKITTILLDMYGVILEESKGFFIPYTFGSFDQAEYDRLTRQFKEEKLFTRAANGEMTSDEFLRQLGFQDPQYHMVKGTECIGNEITLAFLQDHAIHIQQDGRDVFHLRYLTCPSSAFPSGAL